MESKRVFFVAHLAVFIPGRDKVSVLFHVAYIIYSSSEYNSIKPSYTV